MSDGNAAAGMHQWTLDEDAAARFFRQAVELGVTFWDTANVYQGRHLGGVRRTDDQQVLPR